MTSSSRKRSGNEQAGPEEHERARRQGDVHYVEDAQTDVLVYQELSSRKRRSADLVSPGQAKQARIQQDEPAVIDMTDDTDADIGLNGSASGTAEELPKTPSTGSKRSSAHLAPDNENDTNLKANSRAIYNANKGQINTWYDKQHSKKLGIPKHGKIKHSDDPWYQKLAAWQKHKGHIKPANKKRRLNDSSAQNANAHFSPANPRQARLDGDLVSVPERPFDKLEDFEAMPNGNYACSHINRNPPLDCCRTGLTKHAKMEAIKKSKEIWKKQVERLIDAGKLNPAHKEWTNWVSLKLREKYQPALFKEQQEKKAKRVRERERRKRVEAEEKKEILATEGMRQRVLQQQRSGMRPQRRYPDYLVSDNAYRPPMNSHGPRSMPVVRRQDISDEIATTQASLLASLTRTDPRQLHQHDALYRDAQYRESMKEAPDFALLKKWYLAYFLQVKRQPLSAEQRKLLEAGDPSHMGRRRVGVSPTLPTVDSLFSEYLQATEIMARPLGLIATGSVQKSQEMSQTSSQMVSTPTPGLYSATPAVAAGFQDASPAPSAPQAERFELWDPETIDSELDRILTTRPMVQQHARVAPVLQQISRTRSAASYRSSLPQSFATGNDFVDAEMRNMLQYAYQTDAPRQHSPKTEQLLHQGLEDSKTDWQRYCDFFESADGLQPQAGNVPGAAQEPVVDDFDFGEPLTEEQLAVFDFDDPVGRELFALHDAGIAAAHAANLARYR